MYWYYTSFNHRKGPYSIEELYRLYSAGEVRLQTTVFSEALGGWHPLGELFNVTNVDEPEPVRREKELDIPPAAEDEGVVARPWVRFFARMIDYFLFSLVLGIIFGAAHVRTSTTSISMIVMTASITFAWCFIEAALLCSWGSTPGKALLGTHLRKKSGTKMTYSEGLSRALSVWLVGLGCTLPLVVIVTMIVACVKLSNNKITSWDARGEILVQHKKLSWWRILIACIIFLTLVGMITSAR